MPIAHRTTLGGVLLFEPDLFEDRRGFLKETYSKRKYAELAGSDDFVQDNVSCSSRGVLRGLHGDARMSKLVQCLRGSIHDVIVDMNPGSPTYRRWEAFSLTEENHRQLYVPRGFAHGFLALSGDALVHYKQTAYYDPGAEFIVRWNDPAIGVRWPFAPVTMSPRDENAPFLLVP